MPLHIGYSKTGTTTLQNHVFPHFGRFIGKDGEAEDAVRLAAINLLLGLTPKIVLPEADVCSYEIMLRPEEMETLAKRTAAAFPVSKKLFISIRWQDNLIWSQYLHDQKIAAARNHPTYTFGDALDHTMHPCPFPACKHNCLCGPIKKIPLPFYDFDAVYRASAQYFEVLMLPLELLSENASQYTDILFSFTGRDPSGVTKVPVENQGPDAKRADCESQLKQILESFESSNRQLKCPVDLSVYGYF